MKFYSPDSGILKVLTLRKHAVAASLRADMQEQPLVSQGFATRSCHCLELGLLTQNFLGVIRPPPGRSWIHVPYVCRLIHILVLYLFSDHFLRARRSWLLAALWGCGDADKVNPPENSPTSERDRVSHCVEG